MRIGQVGVQRLQPWDRGAVPRLVTAQYAALAPAALFTEDSYIVPAGKLFMLTGIVGQIQRVTAASALGRARLECSDDNGIVGGMWLNSNNVGDGHAISFSPGSVYDAGKSLWIQIEDLSTGGTVLYTLWMSGFEFNA